VAAIVKAAREDLKQQRWARDFADKLRDRDIALDALRHLVNRFDLMVLYWHRGMRAIGFWLKELNLIAVWSPRHPGKWVTAFRHDRGRTYLLSQEDLHERSFVDDPTRIFRAVRYEQRFNFKIEPKTLRLICQARDESFLAKLSRDRIKHELWRILQERDPTKPMRRLSKLRILSVIAPELCVTKERLEWMRKANEWLNWFAEKFPEKPLEREWALLLPLLPTYEAVNSFSQRYQLGESEKECGLALLKALRRRTPKRPSGWVRWLNPLPLEAALVLAAKRSSPNDPAWQRYFLEWRWARPDITGEDLKAHGITGRAISIGLQAALAVKLDEGADARRQLEVALRRAQQCQTSRR